VVFPEREFSEAEQARCTAQRFGIHHQELALSGEDMLARLNGAVGALDQPSMDGINTYFVSWAARQAGLKVALSGLGGDEIFGGYGTFHTTPEAHSVASVARFVPGSIRSAMAFAAERVSKHMKGRHDAHRKMIALWRDPNFLPHPYFYTRLLFTPEQVLDLTIDHEGASSELWEDWIAQSARGAEELEISPLNTTATVASSLNTGWRPPPRSMMLSRRIPRATESSTNRPSSSGPRCCICPIMRRTTLCVDSGSMTPTTPQIPHMIYVDRCKRARPRPLLTKSGRHDAPLASTVSIHNQISQGAQ